MNKLAAICLLAAMALGINARRLNETNVEYVECAAKKWSVVFVNCTYVTGTRECLKGIQDDNAFRALQIINLNDAFIEINQIYYETTADSIEKYDLLYYYAAKFHEANQAIRQLVANLSQDVQDCVAVQLEKVTKRVNDASDCKQLRLAK